jgi:hypothetical protein
VKYYLKEIQTKQSNKFWPRNKSKTNVGGLLLLRDSPPRSTTKIIVEGGKKIHQGKETNPIINVYSFFLLKSKVCIQKGYVSIKHNMEMKESKT